MYRRFFCLLLMLFTLCGCRQEVPQETDPLCRYVTQVDMTCRQPTDVHHKHFTQDAKIESILFYLRLLHDHGDIDTLPPDAEPTDYEIILSFSDGSQRVYHQRGSAYLSQDGGPWLILEQWQGRKLQTLFRLLPSDI